VNVNAERKPACAAIAAASVAWSLNAGIRNESFIAVPRTYVRERPERRDVAKLRSFGFCRSGAQLKESTLDPNPQAADNTALPGQPQRVLVTGGSGFIGSHLSRRLLAQGHEVLVVDNFYSSTRRNVQDLIGEPRFELIRHDVTFPLYIEVDQIYHLACPASPVFYQRDPVQTTKTCVHGSINMLGLAKRLGARILLSSTSEIYGDPLEHPQTESYWGNVNPIGIRSCYDEGKRCAETLFFDYYRQHRLPIKVARIFNTYGPNMLPNDGRVVSSFIVQALRGKPLTVFGDGSQTRSFCYVDDMVDGLIALMNSDHDVTGPVNLGNPGEFTMLELAKKVLAYTGSDCPIEHKPLPSDDPVRRRPDISRAREQLAWQPHVALDDGLPPTVEYFRQALGGR
jgi:UDP-glucuronate decarboxylase